MTLYLGSRKAATKLAISLAARRRTTSSCPRFLSAFAVSNQFYLSALSNATPPTPSNNHLGLRRWMSEESPSSSSSSSSSAPSDRLHSTDIAFKPAGSGWGSGQKYANNFDTIFGGSKTKATSTEETSEKVSTKDTTTQSKS